MGLAPLSSQFELFAGDQNRVTNGQANVPDANVGALLSFQMSFLISSISLYPDPTTSLYPGPTTNAR